MSDGLRAAKILDRLAKIVDGLDIPKRKKDQIRHWLTEIYYCLDI